MLLKLYGREALLILLSAALTRFVVAPLMGLPVHWSLFWIGLFLGFVFVPFYPLAMLGGNKMPAKVRNAIGAVALVALFWSGITTAREALVPAGCGLLLSAVAGLLGGGSRGRGGVSAPEDRIQAASWVAYAYGFPMLAVRWILIPLLGATPEFSALVLQVGAAYIGAHVLWRIMAPGVWEMKSGGAAALRHALPDAVVGLLESTAHRPAKPYATTPDGGHDPKALAVECRPEEADALAAGLKARLAGQPFEAAVGERVGDLVEVVVRAAAR